MKKRFALVLVLFMGVMLLTGCGNNEKELTGNLEKLGKSFYEDYYYPSQKKSQKDVKEFVKRFEKTGIKVIPGIEPMTDDEYLDYDKVMKNYHITKAWVAKVYTDALTSFTLCMTNILMKELKWDSMIQTF